MATLTSGVHASKISLPLPVLVIAWTSPVSVSRLFFCQAPFLSCV